MPARGITGLIFKVRIQSILFSHVILVFLVFFLVTSIFFLLGFLFWIWTRGMELLFIVFDDCHINSLSALRRDLTVLREIQLRSASFFADSTIFSRSPFIDSSS